jgi:cytochrome c-type protein NapC
MCASVCQMHNYCCEMATDSHGEIKGMEMSDKPGFMRRYWTILRTPAQVGMWFVLTFGFFGGIIFWGGFNTTLAATNTEEFCISCHTMNDNVYEEYKTSIHYKNRSGVRAICSDCHVPHEWSSKMMRKVGAAKDVWGQITGVINTPEKFEEHRLGMATREWGRFRRDNSLACRNCHETDSFDFSKQGDPGTYMHQTMLADGGFTCIDCHKGIAHTLPKTPNLGLLAPVNLVREAEDRRDEVRSYLYDK